MKLEKIEKLQISLMNKVSDVLDKSETPKANYEKKITANLLLSKIQLKDENELNQLIYLTLEDLFKRQKEDVDSVGMWITYDEKIYENSMSLSVLNEIKEYSSEDINPYFELFKMTIPIDEETIE